MHPIHPCLYSRGHQIKSFAFSRVRRWVRRSCPSVRPHLIAPVVQVTRERALTLPLPIPAHDCHAVDDRQYVPLYVRPPVRATCMHGQDSMHGSGGTSSIHVLIDIVRTPYCSWIIITIIYSYRCMQDPGIDGFSPG